MGRKTDSRRNEGIGVQRLKLSGRFPVITIGRAQQFSSKLARPAVSWILEEHVGDRPSSGEGVAHLHIPMLSAISSVNNKATLSGIGALQASHPANIGIRKVDAGQLGILGIVHRLPDRLELGLRDNSKLTSQIRCNGV